MRLHNFLLSMLRGKRVLYTLTDDPIPVHYIGTVVGIDRETREDDDIDIILTIVGIVGPPSVAKVKTSQLYAIFDIH